VYTTDSFAFFFPFFGVDFIHIIHVFKNINRGRFERDHLSYANRLFCNYISSSPYISVSNIGALQVNSLAVVYLGIFI
jgi:hypothetical protein